MRILAIESSSMHNSIAIWDSGSVIALETFESPRRQSGPLFSITDRLLKENRGPDRIVVGIGPGSYSGIRTAITLGQGLAMALGVPLVGLSSLLALDVPPTHFRVFGNARSDQAWIAEVENRQFITSPQLIAHENLSQWLADQSAPVFRIGPFIGHEAIASAFPSASHLATLGALADATTCTPEPLYLKEAHITQNRVSPESKDRIQ